MTSKIIKYNTNGHQIILRTPIKGLESINPTTVLGFMSDKVLSDTNREFIQSRPILCMPVHRSPILTYNSWCLRYTDSLSTLTLLKNIQSCYTDNIYEEYNIQHHERIAAASTELSAGIATLDSILFDNDLVQLYAQYGNVASEEACTLLINLLERYTLNLINLYEKCIHDMFIPEIEPATMFFTPHETPDLTQLMPDSQQKLHKKAAELFKTKDIIQNIRLEKAGCAPARYFSEAQSEIKYKNYLGQQRIIEYFAFLNINNNE